MADKRDSRTSWKRRRNVGVKPVPLSGRMADVESKTAHVDVNGSPAAAQVNDPAVPQPRR